MENVANKGVFEVWTYKRLSRA